MRVTRIHVLSALCASLLLDPGHEAAAQTETVAMEGAGQPGSESGSLVAVDGKAASVTDVVSREVAVLTDAPPSLTEATSRDLSVLADVTGILVRDVVSREASVLTDAGADALSDATSREVSALVDPPIPGPPNALTREVSVLTDISVDDLRDLASRELSVYVNPSLALTKEAASREISVLVDAAGGAIADASTREVAVLTDLTVMVRDASAREVSILVDPPFATAPDASSRELAVLVSVLLPGLSEGVSREVSVLTVVSGTGGDASSREVSVLTGAPTSTLLTMMTARASLDGIEVRWQFGGQLAVESTGIERASRAEGPFEALAVRVSEEAGVYTAVDGIVEPDRTYWYRVVANTDDGKRLTFGPIAATVGGRVTDLHLAPIAPSPAYGRITVSFAVPHEMDVRVSVFDVLGREAAVLIDQRYLAGWYSGSWDLSTRNGRAGAGIYFVRLRTREKSLSRKFVIGH